jgi:hypothetical protein
MRARRVAGHLRSLPHGTDIVAPHRTVTFIDIVRIVPATEAWRSARNCPGTNRRIPGPNRTARDGVLAIP